MLEIEQKFAVANFLPIEEWMKQHGLEPGEPRQEEDCYLNAPDRDFARTGEAFRLRRSGSRNWLTYKGPKRAGPVKIRKELEPELCPGEQAALEILELFECLGYRQVARVRKTRRTCTLERDGFDVTLSLDEVEKAGTFVEVEILAPEEQADAAREALTRLTAELGLTRLETRSYLGIVLELEAPMTR
jgi:adenylate cyclase class 2